MKIRLHLCDSLIALFQNVVIEPDDEIRLKIVGTRVDATDIVSMQLFLVGVKIMD